MRVPSFLCYNFKELANGFPVSMVLWQTEWNFKDELCVNSCFELSKPFKSVKTRGKAFHFALKGKKTKLFLTFQYGHDE